MKNFFKIFVLVVVVFLFMGHFDVFAATLYDQPDQSGTLVLDFSSSQYQQVGSFVASEAGSLGGASYVYGEWLSGSCSTPPKFLLNDPIASQNDYFTTVYTNPPGAPGDFVASTQQFSSLVVGRTYNLYIECDDPSAILYFSADASNTNWWGKIVDDNGDDTFSSITAITPVKSITPVSSPVTLSVSYMYGHDVGSSTPSLKITLLNQDTATYTEWTAPLSTGFGLHTYSTTTSLADGLYQYSVLWDNSPNVYVATSSQFIVNSTQFPTNSLNSYFYGSTYGTSTPSLTTNFLEFLNVPNLLATKVPFAYVFQVGTALAHAVSSSTITSTLPSSQFSVTIGTSTYATVVHVDLFSTTTITHFLTPSAVAPIRALMVVVTYFSLGWFLFHEAKSRKLL